MGGKNEEVLPVRTRRVAFLGSFTTGLPAAHLPEIAFAGRSNVGKSSALNALVGARKAARVSKTPGRTQALNLFDIDDRVTFVDLPGYGYAKVPADVQQRWKAAIEAYLGGRRALRMVVCLVDARLPAQPGDVALITGLRDAGLPFLVVATKLDKLKRSQRGRQIRQLIEGLAVPRDRLVPFSSETNLGVTEVWKAIESAIRVTD